MKIASAAWTRSISFASPSVSPGAARAVAPLVAMFVSLVVLLIAPLRAHAEGTTFQLANQSYTAGHFEDAIGQYEALVASGVVHEDLYYNLGNAYFRSGKLGPAIFNYERALRVDAGMEDARHNMEVARDAVAERVVDRLKGAEADPWWIKVVNFFSASQLTLGFLALNVVFFSTLIALRLFATGLLRTALIACAGFVGVAALTAFILLRGHAYVEQNVYQGMVIADQVVLREGSNSRSAEKGTLHPGVMVSLRAREVGWLHIRLANGMEGWVPEAAIGRL